MNLEQLKNIVTGCADLVVLKLFHKAPAKVELIYQVRLDICKSCSLYDNNSCSPNRIGIAVTNFNYYQEKREKGKEYKGCGCNLGCKTLIPTENCPIGKWLNIETDMFND